MDERVEVKDEAQSFGLENWGPFTERENSEKGAGLGSGLSSVLKLFFFFFFIYGCVGSSFLCEGFL